MTCMSTNYCCYGCSLENIILHVGVYIQYHLSCTVHVHLYMSNQTLRTQRYSPKEVLPEKNWLSKVGFESTIQLYMYMYMYVYMYCVCVYKAA